MYPQLYPRQRRGSQLNDTRRAALTRFGVPDLDSFFDNIDGVRSTILNIDIPFTGLAGNTQSPQNTREYPFALVILAAQTNLENITVKLYDASGKELMPSEIPIQAIAALRENDNPWFPWPWPHVIPPNGHIRVQSTDVNGEGAGSILFECLVIPADVYDSGKLDAITKLKPWWEKITVTFNGTANEETRPPSTPQEEPIIVTGFQTGLQSAKIRVLFPSEQELAPEFVPIASYAQPPTAFLHYQPLRVPRLLGKRARVTFNLKNAGTEASGNIVLYGVKDQR